MTEIILNDNLSHFYAARKLNIDRQEMADLAGTTKEQVSRILADFDHEELIRFRAKHFKYIAIDKLRQISENHATPVKESMVVEA
jgi:CRP-like cAMP-binding protein